MSGRILFVVPCGRAKLARPAPARELYTGAMFRFALSVVEAEAEHTTALGMDTHVAIFSARHGLLDPDIEVEPYEQAMTHPGSITADAVADQLAGLCAEHDAEAYAFLPKAYLARLRAAAIVLDQRRDSRFLVHDVYEATAGIGEQRRVLANLGRSHTILTDRHTAREDDHG